MLNILLVMYILINIYNWRAWVIVCSTGVCSVVLQAALNILVGAIIYIHIGRSIGLFICRLAMDVIGSLWNFANHTEFGIARSNLIEIWRCRLLACYLLFSWIGGCKFAFLCFASVALAPDPCHTDSVS